MNERDTIDDLVARYVDLKENGVDIGIDAYIAQHGDAAGLLRAALLGLEQLEGRLPSLNEGSGSTPIVPGFRLLSEIGRGGHGVVFLAEPVDSPGERVALKILGLAASFDRRALERFTREADILRRVSSPSIVRVRDVCMAGPSPLIVLDHVPGRDLSALIASAVRDGGGLRIHSGESASPADIASFVATLAHAVQDAHDAGIMHRDLKPSNVMVRPDGSPVLLDFGLAADAQAATLTRTGDILGTPRYIAPELARGEHADARTDVYGLGLILFEMVALRPAQACGGGTRGVTSSVRLLPAPPLRRAARDCPRALDAICNTAIAYRRRRRFPACEDLAEALEAFAAGRRSNLRSPGLVSRWIDHAVARPMHAAGVGLVTLVVALTLALLRDRAPSALDIERTFDRALVAWVDGDAARAGSTLRALLDRSPDHADGRFLEGLIVNRLPAARGDPYLTALAQGRTKDAERASDACVDAYTTARSLEPGSPLPIVLLSLAALDHGYVDLARRHLETATRELPECQALSRALAKTLLATKDYEAASQRFAEAVAQRPDDRELWHDLVRSRYYAGDGDGAMDAIRRALAHLKPEDGDWLLLSQAQILDLNRRHDEARELCSRVLEHTPDHRRALRLVAASWDREHRFQDAEEAYLRVLEHHPRDVHSHYALAHMYAGANRSICAGCARHFDDHPEALKPDCSLHHLEEVHRLLAGREPDVLRETLAIARRAGRGPGLIPVLREVRMRLLAGIEAGKPLGARLDIVTLLLAEIEGG